MSNELGQFLEKLRGKMTLRTAAEKSGLSHSYIRDLELGVNRATKAPIHPSAESLKKLAKAYNYPSNDLLKKAGYIEETNDDTADFADILNDPDFELFYYDAKDLSEKRKQELRNFIKFLKSQDENN